MQQPAAGERAGVGRDLETAARVQYYEIGGKVFSIVAATAIEHYGGANYNQTRHAAEDQAGVGQDERLFHTIKKSGHDL